MGVYPDPDSAVAAARRGFEANEKTPIQVRAKMIEAMRKVTLANLEKIARYALEETGLGRYDDKLAKNTLVATKTPGVEILRPVAFTGDDGLMLTERAPYGVIFSVTPTTNPTETILCNSIGMIAGGNAVVFNVHPAAAGVCNWFVHLLNEAIAGVGGPRDTIVSIEKPTIKSAQALFVHKGVRLVVVTGGPAVVKAAMSSGKKVIAAGPGNPPSLVDETANLDTAAIAIVKGASIDNNIICTAEKEIVAVDSIADDLMRRLEGKGCLKLSDRQVRELERVVLDGDHVNKNFRRQRRLGNCRANRNPRSWPRSSFAGRRPRREPPVRSARTTDASCRHGSSQRRGRGNCGLASGRTRFPSHRDHALDQHRQHDGDGSGLQLLDLCQKRLQLGWPWTWRRGLHLVHHREPDR